MEWLFSPEALIALVTLTALEIVLGIDNIIFLTILVAKLPPAQQQSARIFGLALAALTRIGLLLTLSWLARLTSPLFTVFAQDISGRDLVLFFGGLFLIAKSALEIHESLEGADRDPGAATTYAKFWPVVTQIAIIDIVFSLDSVITAVGLVNQIPVMVTAILIAIGVMMFAAKPIGDFVDAHPTIKMLALSFLIMIGGALVAESVDMHVPKGYMYFAMAFSVGVEMLNIRLRKKQVPPVKLRNPFDQIGGKEEEKNKKEEEDKDDDSK